MDRSNVFCYEVGFDDIVKLFGDKKQVCIVSVDNHAVWSHYTEEQCPDFSVCRVKDFSPLWKGMQGKGIPLLIAKGTIHVYQGAQLKEMLIMRYSMNESLPTTLYTKTISTWGGEGDDVQPDWSKGKKSFSYVGAGDKKFTFHTCKAKPTSAGARSTSKRARVIHNVVNTMECVSVRSTCTDSCVFAV